VDDKELADAIVALGVGRIEGDYYVAPQDYMDFEVALMDEPLIYFSQFVRDWRVAGAMMEKLESYDGFLLRQSGDDTGMCRVEVAGGVGVNGNMCRAICEACVEALK